MPFRRRRRFTRFRRRRRGGFRGRSRFTRLSRAVRFINKRMTTEVKKFDVNVADATVDAGGVVFPITAIAQGDTSANREGNQIRIKYITCLGTAAPGTVTLRLVLVQDTQMTPATAPTIAQIFEGTDPRTLMNRQSATAGRFNIIWDRLFTTYPGNATEPSSYSQVFRFTKRLDRKPYVKTTWTDGTNTNYQNGHVFLAALVSTDELAGFESNFRVGYYDN